MGSIELSCNLPLSFGQLQTCFSYQNSQEGRKDTEDLTWWVAWERE